MDYGIWCMKGMVLAKPSTWSGTNWPGRAQIADNVPSLARYLLLNVETPLRNPWENNDSIISIASNSVHHRLPRVNLTVEIWLRMERLGLQHVQHSIPVFNAPSPLGFNVGTIAINDPLIKIVSSPWRWDIILGASATLDVIHSLHPVTYEMLLGICECGHINY